MKKVILFLIFSSFFTLGLLSRGDVEKKVVTAKSGLNMRSEPTVNGNKILTIPFQSEVIVTQKKSEKTKIGNTEGYWVKVKFEKSEGWVFDAYLADKTVINNNQEVNDNSLSEKLKNGACLPCPACDKKAKCDLSANAPCYEGVKFYSDGRSFTGSCDSGSYGTWTLEENKIIIVVKQDKKSDCIAYCNMDYDTPEQKKRML